MSEVEELREFLDHYSISHENGLAEFLINLGYHRDVGDKDAEWSRLRDIEFEHQGCRMFREKDNGYLIERAEKAEKEVDRLKGVCEYWGSNYQSWVDGFAAFRADIQKLVDDMEHALEGEQPTEFNQAGVGKYISEELRKILETHPKILKVDD